MIVYFLFIFYICKSLYYKILQGCIFTMTIYNRIIFISLLGLFVFSDTTLWAQAKQKKVQTPPLAVLKKSRNAKSQYSEILGPVEPDRLPPRCKPDRIIKPVHIPYLFNYPAMDFLHGYDMSHYQGMVDWDIIAKDPLAGFIYLKATEGVALTDSKYNRNLEEARRCGLKVGSYHFFRAQLNPTEQYDLFMSTIDIKKQDLIPLVDVEVLPRRVSHSLFIKRLEIFCELLEKAFGCKPMIYTGKNFYEKHLAHTSINARDYKFMIAAYVDEEPVLKNEDDYLIWQFTGSGTANGIRGKVDISRFRGNHKLNEILYQ